MSFLKIAIKHNSLTKTLILSRLLFRTQTCSQKTYSYPLAEYADPKKQEKWKTEGNENGWQCLPG